MPWWEITLIAVGGAVVGGGAALYVIAWRFTDAWDRAWGYK